MGGRGSFVDIDNNNFAFKEGGQTYFSIGVIDNDIKILERPRHSVKAPEFSHTKNRIYAIVQEKKLKHISFYNEKHELIKSIDFQHFHEGLKPHVHNDIYHEKNVTSPSESDYDIIKKINDWLIKNKYDGVL